MASLVKQTEVRGLGKTEMNWVAAVESGTGITISSILFDRRVPVGELKGAVCDLLALHPRLRSLIVAEGRTFHFHTPEEVFVRFSEVDVSGEYSGDEDGGEEPWHAITEAELNSAFSKDYPVPVFQPKLYLLPGAHSLLVLRVHAAAADMASTPTMVKQIVTSLRRGSGTDYRNVSGGDEEALPSLEDAVPPGQADKPFWAHGVDVLGYGLSSRRHAYLPFLDTEGSRTSKLLRAALTARATALLLKECEDRGVSVYGVIIAAALKAVAAYKQVGARGEHYGVTVLMQCRIFLQPPLPDSAIGFYHSALLRTIHTTEPESFWELATRCSQDYDTALHNRKHFTDMGDLNALMEQAMRFPALTPSGSMRTSAFSTIFDPVVENLREEEAAAVGVKDYLSCSSTHGVGPCLALFPFMRHGSLRFSFVYPTPLFSKSLMQSLVDSILFFLSEDDEPVE